MGGLLYQGIWQTSMKKCAQCTTVPLLLVPPLQGPQTAQLRPQHMSQKNVQNVGAAGK